MCASVGAAGLLIWIIMQRGHAFHNQFGELWFSAAHDTSGCRQSVKGRCVWLREREGESFDTPRGPCAHKWRENSQETTLTGGFSHISRHTVIYPVSVYPSSPFMLLSSLCKTSSALQTFANLFRSTVRRGVCKDITGLARKSAHKRRFTCQCALIATFSLSL